MGEKWKNWLLICLPGAFILIFTLAQLLLPDQSLSVSERRPLASMPQITGEAIASGKFMTDFEQYTLDQFPLRDSFRSLKALVTFALFQQKDNHGLYVAEGYVAKVEDPLDIQSLDYAAQRFQFVYDTYLREGGSKVYLGVIPDKNAFLAEEYGYPALDYGALVDRLRQQAPFAQVLDLMPLLEQGDYYRTDTHWRQEQIGDVASFLVEQMGGDLEAAYQTCQASASFYGVYAGQLALPLPPEPLNYLTNPVIDALQVYDYETQAQIPVYDLERAEGQDPYEMFLGGSKSLLTIENPNASTERELILVRDSFGSSLAPLLAQAYAKVTVVDIRYLSPELLGNFLTVQGQDVLFLYSSSVLNHSITIK